MSAFAVLLTRTTSPSVCKANDPLGLTEACFHKTPLLFTGSTSLRWGGRSELIAKVKFSLEISMEIQEHSNFD